MKKPRMTERRIQERLVDLQERYERLELLFSKLLSHRIQEFLLEKDVISKD